MSKRNYEDDDERHRYFGHPRHGNFRNSDVTKQNAGVINYPLVMKSSKKSNAFHVDALLSDKHSSCNKETRQYTYKKRQEEDVFRSHPPFDLRLHSPPSPRRVIGERFWTQWKRYRYNGSPPFYSPPLLASDNFSGLPPDKWRRKCSNPSFREHFNAYLNYYDLHSYRSRESGSADSVGSTCNSVERKSPYDEINNLNVVYKKVKYEQTERCFCADCASRSFTPKRRFLSPETLHSKRKYKAEYEEPASQKNTSYVADERQVKKEQPTFINELKDHVSEDDKCNASKEKEEDINATLDNHEGNELYKKLPAGHGRNRALANLLERRRVAELNTAFEKLRGLVPCYGNENKALSKIKTLKYTLTYIVHLMKILDEPFLVGYFHIEKDLQRLSNKDPLMRKCIDHMFGRKVF